jgi:ribose/xylose/arabinose/galactoside ABC-type transport system permease subunit
MTGGFAVGPGRLGDFAARNIYAIVIVVELVIGYALEPDHFLTPANIQVILFACVVNGFLAMAQAVVLIGREIDLTVGANLVVAPMLAIQLTNVAFRLVTGKGILIGITGLMTGGWLVVVVLTIVIATLIGLANGLLVSRARVPAFIATMGMGFFLVGIAYILSAGTPIFFQNLEDAKFIGNASLGGVLPVSFVVFAGAGVLMAVIMRWTRFGMRVYATGGNEVAARLAGINTQTWKTLAFVAGGTLVGVGAVLHMSRMQGVDVSQYASWTLPSIVICIIGGISVSGGRGSILAVVQATVITALLFNILSAAGFDHFRQLVVSGAVLIILASAYKRSESQRLQRLKIIEV